MPSFDVTNEVDFVEVRNAIDQANKEVTNRFDFKGTDARVELADKALTVFADTDFQLDQVWDVLSGKFAKRGVDVRCMEPGEVQKVGGNKVKREVAVKAGIEVELGKKIVRLLKDSKLKVQASIQGETVRVSGAKRDVLQEAIAHLRKSITDFPLQFGNFRE